ncbi:MAG: adenosylmethionine decarboxylase [Chloroflexi bacterium]|nr:adenosylmethionine decarboxylase [Chloroflexota bacterium]
METFGRHVIAELSGCNPGTIRDIKLVEKYLESAVREAGATIVSTAFHHFSPEGISGVIVLAESHLAVHTWPEHGYVAMDIYTCGKNADPWAACRYLVEKFEAKDYYATHMQRGISQDSGIYAHAKRDYPVETGSEVLVA